jgi:PiT family inorganic phosphate transporter
MTGLTLVNLAAVLLLAFANGSNDNAKGVATLIGSRTLATRLAIALAAVATLMGSVAAIFLAQTLLSRFTGKGLVADHVVAAPAFATCVGLGAAATVLVASRIGAPISTTHAIVGAIAGTGLAAGALNGSTLLAVFVVPLVASPLLAFVLAAIVYSLFRTARLRMGVTHETCLCVDRRLVPVSVDAQGAMAVRDTGLRLRQDQVEACRQTYAGRLVGLSAQRCLDGCHLFSAGLLSFARGLNDTPKIAALMLAAGSWGGAVSNGAVGAGILVGGLLAVRRVAGTMSHRITGMNDGQAFSANLVSATLVTLATLKFGVPVSTTHTSCGSLFGIGAVNGRARWRVVSGIVAGWALTLPAAAAAAALAWALLGS